MYIGLLISIYLVSLGSSLSELSGLYQSILMQDIGTYLIYSSIPIAIISLIVTAINSVNKSLKSK